MAKKKWTVLPGGRVKRWKADRTGLKTLRTCRGFGAPPKHHIKELHRRERQQVRQAIKNRQAVAATYVHPKAGKWYW